MADAAEADSDASLARSLDEVWIDGHLDLASSAIRRGRDLTIGLDALRARERARSKEAMVTLPELGEGGVDVVFATLFVLPSAHAEEPGRGTYDDAAQARALALQQLELYERWEAQGRARILRSRGDLEALLATSRTTRPLGIVVLMEGADPIATPADLAWWVSRGVRIVGPAWKRTRYAGGTGEPGGLSLEGRELIDAMSESGVVLDVSHLAEEASWEAVERHRGPVIASHSNARARVGTDRHLSDAMLDTLAERDGVVGIVLANRFLRSAGRSGNQDPPAPVGLADVVRQAAYVASRIGWERVGIGSDFDGGIGRQETPVELDRGKDFVRLSEAVPDRHRSSFLGGAWLRMLRTALPDG
ncbi:MAG: membrane dipeptidase [Trueperaceae bacterium]